MVRVLSFAPIFATKTPVGGTVQPPRMAPGQDEVRFGTSSPLFKKYGVYPKDVIMNPPPGVDLPDKAVLLKKLLEATEHAQKNQALGNMSGRQKATNLLMENGKWALASNIEPGYPEVFLCGERSSIVVAFNNILKALKLEHLQNKQEVERVNQGMKAKLLVMTGSKLGEGGDPCGDCQTWLATNKYFGPETLLMSLRTIPGTDRQKHALRFTRVGDLMPLLSKQKPSLSSQPISSLPFQYSERAQAEMATKGVTPFQLRSALESAKQAYDANLSADFSGNNTAAAVLLSDGRITTAARFDVTARWYVPADLQALAKGVQSSLAQGSSPRIQAMAYYGNDPKQPNINGIANLAQEGWGSPQGVIAVIEDDVIQVRTLEDYMSNIYVSKFTPAIQRNTSTG